ncbi:MAG: RNA methyltransferase [Peptococcaceae bacterium]|jgi:TrmH family RNA methyltransferase|nr:RNA methyltransferase [Peptococcaceae bacterium]
MPGKNNPHLKYIRRLAGRRFREQEGKLLVEGVRFVEEALNSTWQVDMLVYTRRIRDEERGEKLLQQAAAGGIALLEVEDRLFKELSGTETPQGILAVLHQRHNSLEELVLTGYPLLVVVDGVRDPGNLGAIIRTADAAGASGVILLKGTTDIYNPKTLRATMGSIFHLPVIQGCIAETVIAYLVERGIKIVAGVPRADKVVYKSDLRVPCALAVGGEATGPGQTLLGKVDELVRIPMPGQAESLNVAISAAILLYEAVRQRYVQ